MSENIFGLTVAADKGLDDLQCQRLLSENRRYQEVMLQYRCALKALESRLEILNEEFSLQHDRNPIESMKSRLKSPSSIMNKIRITQTNTIKTPKYVDFGVRPPNFWACRIENCAKL